MIKIVLVEDNQEFRDYFVDIFINDPEIQCIAAYHNAEDLISEYTNIDVSIIFMDIELPQMNGIECIRKLKEINPSVLFIMYTVFENSDTIFDALCAGASGYLLKSSNAEEIKNAVFEISKGGSPMSSIIARKVLQSFHKNQMPSPKIDLFNEIENCILQMLSNGFKHKDIATKLNIDIENIKISIKNIYEKLQVKSRTEALHLLSHDNKYIKSYLTENDSNAIKEKIIEYFETNKPYLDDYFNLKQLSASLNIQSYQISQVINQKLNRNFFDLVNHYKVEEAKTRLINNNGNHTIEGIGYDCGFGSKTSFFSIFKKYTGLSPLEYIKKH